MDQTHARHVYMRNENIFHLFIAKQHAYTYMYVVWYGWVHSTHNHSIFLVREFCSVFRFFLVFPYTAQLKKMWHISQKKQRDIFSCTMCSYLYNVYLFGLALIIYGLKRKLFSENASRHAFVYIVMNRFFYTTHRNVGVKLYVWKIPFMCVRLIRTS